ncbi:MAG: hypothetical protein ACRDOK_10845 [Streptosporangiaceae bacterium]
MRARAVAAALAATAVAATLAGCAASHPGTVAAGRAAPSPSTAASAAPMASAAALPVALPSPDSVSYADPSAVSQAVVIIQWTVDTVTDSSQYQAELRSAPFLAPAYLAQLRANPPVAAPGYQWNLWAAHRAYTTVSAVAEHDDQPADTPTTADRQWGITITPHGAGGWTAAPLTATVFVQLSRSGPGQPWLVSDILADPS